jgi:hypothetical protein
MHLEIRGVDVRMGDEAIADIFANSLIGAAIVLRATTEEAAVAWSKVDVVCRAITL